MKKGYWIVVQDIIRKSDIVLEVLDARFPELTRIRRLEEYVSFHGKKLIIVVNKADIISVHKIKNLKKNYKEYVLLSTKNSKGISELIRRIRNIKIKKPRLAVIGYPNTGKSSLINRLSRGGRARTSSESGFTRGIQFISGKSGIMLIDTPGIVPFKDRDELRLGLVSGISPSKLEDPYMVAYKLIGMFIEENPYALRICYDINAETPEDFLDGFGKKNNMLLKGGIVDETRAAIKILNDWHEGKIKL